MPEVDLDKLRDLVQEVIDLACSGHLLVPTTDDTSRSFDNGRTILSWRVVEISEFIASTDLNAEWSSYRELEELISKAETAYHFVSSHSPPEEGEIVSSAIDRVIKGINTDANVSQFAKEVWAVEKNSGAAETLSHIRTCIASHLAGLIYTRALSLSKRFTPCEVVLDAYRAGLFPFGLDWETDSILCNRRRVEPVALLLSKQ